MCIRDRIVQRAPRIDVDDHLARRFALDRRDHAADLERPGAIGRQHRGLLGPRLQQVLALVARRQLRQIGVAAGPHLQHHAATLARHCLLYTSRCV